MSVRQTGAIAFELSRLVDRRIVDQQKVVFEGLSGFTETELDELPLLQLVDLGEPR